MIRRWRILAVVCALAMAISSGAAMAHHPEEDYGSGERLSLPFGEDFTVFAHFRTAQNPFNAANTHVTSSDIAFWDDLAYVGDYGGVRIFLISRPQTPPLPPECGAAPVSKNVPDGQGGFRYPNGAWEGIRIFDVSDPRDPEQIAAVYQDCGSHTNTLLPAPGGRSIYVLNSSYPLGEGPTCGPLGAAQGRKVNHGVVQVVEVPFSDPAEAFEKTELPIVYPGDADGTYRPVSEHGIVAPLDDFLGCHDLSSFPEKRIVGAACGEQAQVWEIDRKTGLPDTADPMWAYDQPNVDFWHSATFSWDGKIANFIDESFGDGCPTVTTKTGGLPGPPRVFETGNMFFFETGSGDLLSEYRNPRPTNDNTSPTTGKYCSSHLGIPVPAKDRYLLVNAYYRGGTSVIDFSDPTRPKEIAFADLDGTNTWSAYTYPRISERKSTIPVYSNDGLSRNYGTAQNPNYPEE